jgi:hypothetical protein
VSGRIVIDAFAYFRASSTVRPELRSLVEPVDGKTGPEQNLDSQSDRCSDDEDEDGEVGEDIWSSRDR